MGTGETTICTLYPLDDKRLTQCNLILAIYKITV